MKSLITLATSLLTEVGAECRTDVSRDVIEMSRRYKDEGESFLTITLPSFCKSLERALAEGSLASTSLFPNFRKDARGYPLFLGGLLRLVFNSVGRVLDNPSIPAVQGIRQITLVVSKMKRQCSDHRVRKAIHGYVKCENELQELWFNPDYLEELAITSRAVFHRKLSEMDRKVWCGDITPRHGPGATADRLLGNGKYDSTYWTGRLENSFPIADNLLCGYSHYKRLSSVEFVDLEHERPVRVLCVPKTARTARIIAAEPANVQYMQQGLLREFARLFRGNSPFVALDNQVRNRELARKGSCDGSVATLDLSEASDRVHVSVVEAVFKYYPHLLQALLDTRSRKAELPDKTVMDGLVKFASMGSATCFPVESIVFATVVLNAIRKSLTPTEWRRQLNDNLPDTVCAFGDDIIVPKRYVRTVLEDLCKIGARPNPEKSFWTGRFRESCGAEFLLGHSVGCAKLRYELPQESHEASNVIGLIEFRNQLYQLGYWKTVSLIDDRLAQLRIPMPIVETTSPVVGRSSVFGWKPQRYHPDYQSPLVRGLLVAAKIPLNEASEHGSLLKCLLPGRIEPFADESHLRYSGRPHRVATKVGWASPF